VESGNVGRSIKFGVGKKVDFDYYLQILEKSEKIETAPSALLGKRALLYQLWATTLHIRKLSQEGANSSP
jgi:hypothetical protein